MNVKTKFIAIFLSCATVTLLSHAEVNRKGQRAIGLSSWEDVTTPLTAGLNHENHRGSAWCDYDNDGLQDLYVTHFGAFDPNGIYLGSPNQLLRNLGSGVFEDATTVELEANSGLSHHPAWADLDNDGLPDIYISQSSNSGSELSTLLHQDSVGVFSDITNGDPIGMSGILPRGVGWQDVNNDGLVDLLVANSNGDLKKNRMLINAGGTNFTLAATLFSEEMRESRSIGWCDYNNDGLPDVYITNGAEDHSDELQRTNQLYKNMGDGTWTDVAVEAGVGDIGHGRGQVWGDVNNDGFLDLFVGNQKGSDTGGGHNRLFRNNGDGTFNDITAWAGLFESYRTRGVSMADFDNDGYLDIYVVNFGNALPPNHLYRNNGNNTFTEVAGGTLASGGPGNGASASWADFDNDGWVDLYLVGGSTIAPGSGMNLLLRNANQNGNHWFEVELCGVNSNRSAIGARVTISHRNANNDAVTQIREIQSGSGYHSGHMFRAHFGLGASESIMELTVRWPSGIVQTSFNLPVDDIIRVVEDSVFAYDCNRNCIPDYQEILDGVSVDENGNGIPDECDCFGDINGNGAVEVNDLITLISVWGSSTSSVCDLNNDGTVNVNDLILLVAAWNSCN
ncbi:MAG TPA: hypothetical protein EYO40_04835 [Phycisphaerales bacterium]|nr:hypothetical protein [Phycisphaerales bacterium]